MMNVINHTSLPREPLGCGAAGQTVANRALCGTPFEVRTVQLEPGGATALERCAEPRVLLALAGCGKQRIDGAPQAFHAPCTLLAPAGCEHQIVNNGATPLQLVVVATAAPEPAAPESAP